MAEFREIRTFKGRTVKSRTDREYERIFEDLMEFSRFSNVKNIKSQTQLNDYFGDVKFRAENRGRVWNDSSSFKVAMLGAWKRLMTKTTRDRSTRASQVVQGRFFTDFETADKATLTEVNPDGKVVFKSQIRWRNKRVVRYRTRNGRFAKSPIIEESE